MFSHTVRKTHHALTQMATAMPKDNPALAEAFETLCLSLLSQSDSPCEEETLDILLGLPTRDAAARFDVYAPMIDDKEEKKKPKDYSNHARVIKAIVDEAQKNPKLVAQAEKFCLIACEYENDAMQEAGVDGLKMLHKDNPNQLVAQFETILMQPGPYRELAAYKAVEGLFEICPKADAGNPVFTKTWELSQRALVHKHSQKDYISGAQGMGLKNMERWILGTEVIGLSNFSTKQLDELADVYSNIMDNTEIFSDNLRTKCIERSVMLVQHDKKYAPRFEAAYIKKAVESPHSHSRYIGWDALIASGYDVHAKAVSFKETALTVCDEVLAEASLTALLEKPSLKEFKNGHEIHRDIRPINKRLWAEYERKQAEENKQSKPPETIADKAVQVLKHPEFVV